MAIKNEELKIKDKDYNIVVIGGGAAGIMSACVAAENFKKLNPEKKRNAKILLIEKNFSLGKKLLITGKGRCNITTSDTNINNFIEKLGKSGKFLYSALKRS